MCYLKINFPSLQKFHKKFHLIKINQIRVCQIHYHRLKKLLDELLTFCGGDREIIVARELTKRFEEHVGNNIKNVIEHFKNKEVMGEITLVIKGEKQQNQEFNKSDLKKDLQELIKAGLSLSAASKYLAKKHGIKKLSNPVTTTSPSSPSGTSFPFASKIST